VADAPTGWAAISEKDLKKALRLEQFYESESERCRDAGIYLGGCILAAAAVEASLLTMVHLHRDEVERADLVPRLKNGRPKQLLQWNLGELAAAAVGCSWLPAKIGDYVGALRQIRNLVHPGRYIREHSPSRVTPRSLETSLETLRKANRWLTKKNLDVIARLEKESAEPFVWKRSRARPKRKSIFRERRAKRSAKSETWLQKQES
jgi:hypothetical protein